MIKKDNQTIGTIYKGSTQIGKIYKGNILVYQSIKDMIARGVNFVLIHKAKANSLEYLKAFGKCEQSSTPTPDNPIPIICNNGEIKARHQSGLPLGYQAIEYIECTGSQYIDTNYYANTTQTKIQIGLTFTNIINNTNQGIFGARNEGFAGTGSCSLFLVSGKLRLDWPFAGSTNNFDVNVDTFYEIECSRPTIKINETTLTSKDTTSVDLNNTFLIGTFNNSDGTPFSNGFMGYIHFAKLYESDVLIHDYIPARRNSDNELGLYDLVTDTFYTNAGTGTFIAGSDVTDEVEVYADGTEEKVKIHGKNFYNIDETILGYRYDDNGNWVQDNGVRSSDFIKVTPGEKYTYSLIASSAAGICRINFFDKNKNWLSVDKNSFTSANIVRTVTIPSNAYYVRTSEYAASTMRQLELGTTKTDYESYFNGGTATCENLLSVGDYEDIQEVISGNVTRNVGIKVLDGTENWLKSSSNAFYLSNVIIDYLGTRFIPFCTHFKGQLSTTTGSPQVQDLRVCFFAGTGQVKEFYIRYNAITTVEQFKQWLADQYNAGTPVITVYPLATATTETVTTQPMNIQEGTNTIEVAEASLNDLELEIKYKGK